ncbi:unnamed protein product [Linum tenue]|uniref:Uncharacterized protein n=1 Tax=Linum tenue TaxID=586396 RepID=A0AAV0I0N7_9ROSI|nr:unnamed protein product [Linum tenue]
MHSMVSLCLVVVLMQGGDLSSIHMEWAWCKPLSRNFAPFPLVQAPHSSLLHPPTIRLQVVLLDIMVHLLLTQSQESSASHWKGQHFENPSSTHVEGIASAPGSQPSHQRPKSGTPSWTQQQGGSFVPGQSSVQNVPGSSRSGTNIPWSQSTGLDHDKPEDNLSLPDPGDWDPNYSDELLLQEDNYDVGSLSTEFSKGVNLSSGNQPGTVRRSNHQSNPSSYSLVQRQNGFVQSFSHVNVGSPPSAHELHAGSYGHSMSKPSHFTPHLPQNSPRRLGQQASHRGRRANYPGPSIPPASRGRKDHGRFV